MQATPDYDGLVVLAVALMLALIAVSLWATPVEEEPPLVPVERTAP